MFSFRLVSAAVLAGCLVAGCAGRQAAAPEVDLDMVEVRTNFQPLVGMHRVDVESVLGVPTWTGETKDGENISLYQVEGAPEGVIRSIVYDRDGNVLRVYR